MAHQYFLKELAHCHGCGALGGVGDEAQSAVTYQTEQDYQLPGREGFARIDNDIVTIAIFPAGGDPLPVLPRRAVGELLATVK